MDITEKIKEMMVRFDDHVLHTEVKTSDVQVYIFKKPGSFDLYQRFIFTGQAVVVTGDTYDSIYDFNRPISLESFSTLDANGDPQLNFYYFQRQCVSDKNGSSQKKYSNDVALNSLLIHAYSHLFDEEYKGQEGAIERVNEILDDLGVDEIPEHFDGITEFVEFMRENGDAICGYDFWESIEYESYTYTPFWHYCGLIQAAKQLRDGQIK